MHELYVCTVICCYLKLCENKEVILKNIYSGYNRLIIDARAEERFNGMAVEPRPGLRKGHIPKSKNLPINLIFDKETMCLKPPKELKQLFNSLGAENLDTPITTTCGSGITATGLAFDAHILGYSDVKVYDGIKTSSPLPIFNKIIAISKALVPLCVSETNLACVLYFINFSHFF